jgi:hypothetical protein
MTNHSNQPPKTSTPRGVYNPITVPEQDDEEFGPLDSRLTRLLAALLFTIIFVVTWRRPEFAPLTILMLAGCLLYRLDERQRRLATAPLILAAIRLCLMLSAQIAGPGGFSLFSTPIAMPVTGSVADWGITWIPAFLSVCLFYLPRKDSITLKIAAFEAMAVILSSLLPGDGFSAVLAVFNATLFFAVTIGLLLDLKPGIRELFRTPRYQQTPIRVHIPAPPPPRPAE